MGESEGGGGKTAEELALASTAGMFTDQPVKPRSLAVQRDKGEWLRMVGGGEVLEGMIAKARGGNGHANVGNSVMRVAEGYIQSHPVTESAHPGNWLALEGSRGGEDGRVGRGGR
mmetsp:Transcript_8160/g.16473  ORF Transcript_8160/g.16473 Transcript_8160/m.16473 type:complete len:115 (+) Transcript_8160:236-580(+)